MIWNAASTRNVVQIQTYCIDSYIYNDQERELSALNQRGLTWVCSGITF